MLAGLQQPQLQAGPQQQANRTMLTAGSSCPARRAQSARHAAHQMQRCTAAAAADSAVRLTGLRLVMMRHAESEPAEGVQDHARHLTQSGIQQAKQVALRLEQSGWLPDLVLCSTAKRTMQTLEAMQAAVRQLVGVEVHTSAQAYTYAAMDRMLLPHLRELAQEVAGQAKRCVLCLGHNKGWEEVTTSLAGTPVRLETANAALLHAEEACWEEWSSDTQWQLVQVLKPA